MEHLNELGVGGIFAILVLQTVLPYIKDRAKGKGESVGLASACETAEGKLDAVSTQLAELTASTQQMAVVMSRVDDSGAPLVYTPRSLVTAIEKLGGSVDALSARVGILP
mgnify:CR=1 FL=1